jgi:hypothetical protein
MNKFFSILLCCLSLGTSQTTLFGSNYETPNPADNQRHPAVRELFPDTSLTQQIRIPGIPTAMQPTREQATQTRTPENVARLHQAFAAQAPAATNQVHTINAPINAPMDGSTPRPTRATAGQNDLPGYLYTQTHNNHRNFVGQARERHRNQSSQVQRNVTTRPRILIIRLSRQELLNRLSAARRAVQERNNRRHDLYDAQD